MRFGGGKRFVSVRMMGEDKCVVRVLRERGLGWGRVGKIGVSGCVGSGGRIGSKGGLGGLGGLLVRMV